MSVLVCKLNDVTMEVHCWMSKSIRKKYVIGATLKEFCDGKIYRESRKYLSYRQNHTQFNPLGRCPAPLFLRPYSGPPTPKLISPFHTCIMQ